MADIFMGITEFVEVDGEALPKKADFFGGHYDFDKLPDGDLVVISSSTHDGIGFREGTGSRRITTRDELLKSSEEDYW
jgi:hypothetical protein